MVCMAADGKTNKEAANEARAYLTIVRSAQELKVHQADPEYQRAWQHPGSRAQRASSRGNGRANSSVPLVAPSPVVPNSSPALATPPLSVPPLSDPFSTFVSKPAWIRAQNIIPSFPVLCTPPVWLARAVQEAFSIPCRQFLSATTDSEKTQAITAMLKAQQLMLPVPNTENSSVRKAHSLRLDQYAANEGKAMPEAKRPVFNQDAKSAEEVRAARVIRLVRAGKCKKAMKVLQSQSQPADPRKDSVKRQLRTLFPQRPSDVKMPSPPQESAMPVLDEPTIRSTFSKLRESASGPSQMSADFVLSVWDSAICRSAICKLINDLAQGTLPLAVHPLLAASRVVPVPKGASEELGIRPICVGEIITRVATSAVVASIKSHAASHLMPVQRAVGVKGGLESAIHEAQHLLSNDQALLDLDIKNAFNTRHTDKCLSELFAVPALGPVHRLAHWLYAREAPLFAVKDGEVADRLVSSTGPRQGCGIGNLMFCVSIQKEYLRSISRSPNIRGIAIVDNFSLAGPINNLKPAFESFQNDAPAGGSQLQLPKCTLHYFGPAESISQETRTLLEATGIKLNTKAHKYLGGIIGKDEVEMKALALQEVRAMQPLFARLSSPHIPAQIALNLLYVCILPKFNYLLRVCPPSVVKEAAELFDQYVRSAFLERADILERELTPELRRLLVHPIKQGGRGLTSSAEHAASAYISSQALCASILKPVYANENKNSARRNNMEEALAQVKLQAGAVATSLLPAQASNFTDFFAKESKVGNQFVPSEKAAALHKSLTTAINNNRERKVVADCNTAFKRAHHHSLSNGGANLTPTTLPLSPALSLTNQAVSYHHRTALRLPPMRNMPIHCHCNAPNGSFGYDPYHSLNCLRELSHTIQDRHDHIKYTISRWATQLGARVRVEPRNLDHNGDRIPDLLIQIGGKTFLLDDTVTNPLAPSHLAAASSNPKSVLAQAEAKKHQSYDQLAANLGATLVPFAVEATGGFGVEALAFIKELIATADKFKTVWTPRQVIQGLYRSIAISVARGNAAIFQASLASSMLRGL